MLKPLTACSVSGGLVKLPTPNGGRIRWATPNIVFGCGLIHVPESSGDMGPLSLLNDEKLSLPLATALATQVSVTDGFVVSGELAGFWVADGGVSNGRPTYSRNDGQSMYYNGANWRGANAGNEDYPWLATFADSTLTHPAVQQLAAPGRGALLVSGSSQDGVYTKRGIYNASPYYVLAGQPDLGGDQSYTINRSSGGSAWYFYDSSASAIYISDDAVATPDLVTEWRNASDDTVAAITVALTDPQAGVAVLGGTQDGVYTDRGSSYDLGTSGTHKELFGLLGVSDDLVPNSVSSVIPGYNGKAWAITDADASIVYYSLSDVATPDLAGTDKVVMSYAGGEAMPYADMFNGKKRYIGATRKVFWNGSAWKVTDVSGSDPGEYDSSNDDTVTPDLATFDLAVANVAWLNASDDTPAAITVTSVSQGQMDAGLRIYDIDTYVANGNKNGRVKYSDVLGVQDDVSWDFSGSIGELGAYGWVFSNGAIVNYATTAFPWQGTPEVSVLQDPVASEQNWTNV